MQRTDMTRLLLLGRHLTELIGVGWQMLLGQSINQEYSQTHINPPSQVITFQGRCQLMFSHHIDLLSGIIKNSLRPQLRPIMERRLKFLCNRVSVSLACLVLTSKHKVCQRRMRTLNCCFFPKCASFCSSRDLRPGPSIWSPPTCEDRDLSGIASSAIFSLSLLL